MTAITTVLLIMLKISMPEPFNTALDFEKYLKRKEKKMGKIQIKRGLSANIPTEADNGELLFTIDTKKFYVGNGSGSSLTEFENVNQINTKLSQKSEIGHNHTSSEITDFNNSVDVRINAQKGVVNGIATLDLNGKIPSIQIPARFKEAEVVADISARDALSAFSGLHALVLNATADTTVSSGGAEYVYDGSIWHKISEFNNLETIVDWASIENKPYFVQTFLDLIDTPESFSGYEGMLVSVKSDLSGLEFVPPFSGDVDGGIF